MKEEKSYIGNMNTKICNCIGADKCNDESCDLVKIYKERHGKMGLD